MEGEPPSKRRKLVSGFAEATTEPVEDAEGVAGAEQTAEQFNEFEAEPTDPDDDSIDSEAESIDADIESMDAEQGSAQSIDEPSQDVNHQPDSAVDQQVSDDDSDGQQQPEVGLQAWLNSREDPWTPESSATINQDQNKKRKYE